MTRGGAPFDPTLWNHWWAFNNAAYLDLRRHVHEVGVVTGSDSFFLGQGAQPESAEAWSPRRADIDGKVVPALIHVLETERSNHMLSAALIALAKIGADSPMPAAFEQALLPFLADSTQEVAESAAIGLGILARDNVLPTLAHLARDTQRGRKLVGRKSEVPYRTRAFAAFGLGLLAERTFEEDVRRTCAAHVIELLEAPHFSTRDIKIAAITALGLCRLDDREGEVAVSTEEGLAHSELSLQASSCRSALLDYLLDYFDPDQRRSHDRTRHELVLAHAPRTLVRLLPDESRDTGHQWKQRVWELFAGSLRPHAKERLEIVQGALFSLGQLGDADDDPVDQAATATLTSSAGTEVLDIF